MNDVVVKDWKEDLSHYRKCLQFMEADAPIQVLCLPKTIETILLREGFSRIYDILKRDILSINGMGERRAAILSTRLNEFLSVGI